MQSHHSRTYASGDTLPRCSLTHTHTIITFNIPNHTSHQLRRPNDSISPSFQQLRQQIIKDHYLPSARWTAISRLCVFHLSSSTFSLVLFLSYSGLPPQWHVHVSANKSSQFVPSPPTWALIFIYDLRKRSVCLNPLIKHLSNMFFLAIVIWMYRIYFSGKCGIW